MHSGWWFMRRRFLKIYQHFPYWAPKGPSPFIWTNLNPHPPGMFSAKFGWNWPSGSWEEFVYRKTLMPNGQQMTDAAPWHKLSWPLAMWAKNYRKICFCFWITRNAINLRIQIRPSKFGQKEFQPTNEMYSSAVSYVHQSN